MNRLRIFIFIASFMSVFCVDMMGARLISDFNSDRINEFNGTELVFSKSEVSNNDDNIVTNLIGDDSGNIGVFSTFESVDLRFFLNDIKINKSGQVVSRNASVSLMTKFTNNDEYNTDIKLRHYLLDSTGRVIASSDYFYLYVDAHNTDSITKVFPIGEVFLSDNNDSTKYYLITMVYEKHKSSEPVYYNTVSMECLEKGSENLFKRSNSSNDLAKTYLQNQIPLYFKKRVVVQ